MPESELVRAIRINFADPCSEQECIDELEALLARVTGMEEALRDARADLEATQTVAAASVAKVREYGDRIASLEEALRDARTSLKHNPAISHRFEPAEHCHACRIETRIDALLGGPDA